VLKQWETIIHTIHCTVVRSFWHISELNVKRDQSEYLKIMKVILKATKTVGVYKLSILKL
jgi:hypothetical protein